MTIDGPLPFILSHNCFVLRVTEPAEVIAIYEHIQQGLMSVMTVLGHFCDSDG